MKLGRMVLRMVYSACSVSDSIGHSVHQDETNHWLPQFSQDPPDLPVQPAPVVVKKQRRGPCPGFAEKKKQTRACEASRGGARTGDMCLCAWCLDLCHQTRPRATWYRWVDRWVHPSPYVSNERFFSSQPTVGPIGETTAD